MSNGSAEHSLTYGYDDSGRLASVTSPAGTFTYTYTPNSSLIASVSGPIYTVTNFWETHRNVLDIKENKIISTNTTISSFNYGVNAIGQRTGVTTTGSAFPSQPADWTWGYDALGQVTSADSPVNNHDRAYEYDQIGNRKKSADGAIVTTGSTATVYDANPLNQYSQISVPSVSAVVPIHDQDGNATSYPLPVGPTNNATLVYDGENRLISVTTGTTTVSYNYDAQSRRVARTEGSNVTLYLYDDWNCIAEYALHSSNFTLHSSFSWGLDISGSLQGAGGVGGLLAVTKHEAQSTTHFYPTYDGNGNVSEYLDAGGVIIAHYEYDPFGRTIVESGPNAADFAYRFSTKPVDAATGLYYYGYRWYDPGTGRWINRDPIEESGGVNLYGFVTNGTVNSRDYLGMSPAGQQIVNNAINRYLEVYSDTVVGKVSGLTDAISRLRDMKGYNVLKIGEDKRSRDYQEKDGKDSEMFYHSPSKTVYVHELDDLAVMHELKHAWHHLYGNRSHTWQDEGEAYLLQYILGNLQVLAHAERNLNGASCSKIRSDIGRDWRNFWDRRYDFHHDGWGFTMRKGERQNRTRWDFTGLKASIGINVSCSLLEKAINDKLPKECCVRVSCQYEPYLERYRDDENGLRTHGLKTTSRIEY